MKNKLNESIGLTLSVPIFSNRENKSAVEKAKLQISEAELEYLNAQKELQKTIEDIYLNATSSQAQYAAAIEHLRLQILAQQHALIAVCGGCDEASGLFLVVQQGEDVAHLAVQLRPIQQVLLAAQKDVGFDRVLQDGGGGADGDSPVFEARRSIVVS